MNTLLNEMLLSLYYSMHADILALNKQFSSEVCSMVDRVPNIGESLGEMTTTIEDLIEAHDECFEERTWTKAKNR